MNGQQITISKCLIVDCSCRYKSGLCIVSVGYFLKSNTLTHLGSLSLWCLLYLSFSTVY